jgi:hypothetical protein
MKPTLALLAVLAVAAPATAQAGTFTTYGTACSGISGTPCVSANDSSPINLKAATGATANFAIIANTGSAQRIVTGWGFYTKTSQPATTAVDSWIFSATSSNQPNASLASSKIQMTTTLGWQTTGQLKDPTGKNIPFLLMPANTTFFVVFSNAQARCNPLPIVSSGTVQTHFFNGPPTWSGPHNTQPWVYQVYCLGGATPPKLSNTGVPTINKSFSIDLSQARSNVNSILVIGLVKTSIDLTPSGAPGCSLYTNPLVLLAGTTTNTGTRTMSFPIPNDSRLVSFQFYSQYVVYDNGNALGLLWTEGGEAKVGR